MTQWYRKYFREELKERPYESEEEAVEDIRSLVDICLNAAFYGRDAQREQLDMRGVVITPQEFYQALTDGTLEAREKRKQFGGDLRKEVRAALNHMESRRKQSRQNMPRICQILQALKLNEAESLCFFLAVVCDYDRKYERLYGYIQDNIGAKMPTVGLGLSLYAGLCKEGETAWIPDTSPLWIYLLKEEKWDASQSKLSKPMAVREMVIRFMKEGAWFVEPLPQFVKLIKEEKRMEISLAGLVEASANMPSYAGTSPEMHLADLVLMSKLEGLSVRLSYGGKAEQREQIKKLSWSMPVLGLERQQEEELSLDAVNVRLVYKWEDLILEESQKYLLRQICYQAAYRELVMQQWGFGRKAPYGTGVSAVFYGAPGTGKTMAAQVMGNELGQKVYKVDVSRLISKYVGETEKNIGELFDCAQEQKVILFFDEADGLFAKRSSVTNSNDRYANMETGYLLQRFEEYEGIAILATNFINNIDEAFKRRIKFFVRFTFPDKEMRFKLWQNMIPKNAPVEEALQFRQFADRHELAGSGIREISINAAFLAAASSRGIRNEDIRQAIKFYYLKLGKKIGDEELI